MLQSFFGDLRQAIRVLGKSRRFTLAVVITLAIGIASNTLIFGVAQGIFLRPMAYPDASRLVYVSQAYPGFPQGAGQFAYPFCRHMLEQNRSFDSLAAYQVTGPLAITDGAKPVRIAVTYCTPNYLTLLGMHTSLGRVFQESEDRFGSADPVLILSYSFWQRQF